MRIKDPTLNKVTKEAIIRKCEHGLKGALKCPRQLLVTKSPERGNENCFLFRLNNSFRSQEL